MTKYAEQYTNVVAVIIFFLSYIYAIPMIAITIRRLHDTGKSARMLIGPSICMLIVLMGAFLRDTSIGPFLEIIGFLAAFVGMILNWRVFFRLFHRTEEDSEWAFTPQI